MRGDPLVDNSCAMSTPWRECLTCEQLLAGDAQDRYLQPLIDVKTTTGGVGSEIDALLWRMVKDWLTNNPNSSLLQITQSPPFMKLYAEGGVMMIPAKGGTPKSTAPGTLFKKKLFTLMKSPTCCGIFSSMCPIAVFRSATT